MEGLIGQVVNKKLQEQRKQEEKTSYKTLSKILVMVPIDVTDFDDGGWRRMNSRSLVGLVL
jgi:hypothetical protein